MDKTTKDLDKLEVSFIPMKNVEAETGIMNSSIKKYFKEVKRGYTPFINGDILFAKITPCMENGKIAIANNLYNGIGFGSTEFHVIRLKQVGLVIKYFFFYLLQEEFRKDARRHMKGTAGQLRVPSNYMQESLIPIPPSAEQKRIVSKLEELFSKLDAGIEYLKKTQILLKQYRQSVLNYAFEGKLTEKWREDHRNDTIGNLLQLTKIPTTFDLPCLPLGWVWINIRKVEKFLGSGITPKGGREVYINSGIPFIRSQNVYPDGLHLENVVYVSRELHEKMSRTHVQPDDILLNITGASIGRCTCVPPNILEANVNQHVCIIRIDKIILPQFLSNWLNSFIAQKIIFNINKGVTRQGLNYSHIRSIPLPLTSSIEQLEIINQIKSFFSIIKHNEITVKESLLRCLNLRHSILKQAFEGKLVPQDSNDESALVLINKINQEKLKQTKNNIKLNSKQSKLL